MGKTTFIVPPSDSAEQTEVINTPGAVHIFLDENNEVSLRVEGNVGKLIPILQPMLGPLLLPLLSKLKFNT